MVRCLRRVLCLWYACTVRGVSVDEIKDMGASMVLANTYHLWVRPGHRLVERLGGLHQFMAWDGPILTDSGGFQVFSLRHRNKTTEDGVKFCSPEDGQWRLLTPEVSIEVQEALGVDVAMAFDECLEWPATRERTIASTERTTRWLHRFLAARQQPERTAVFGIVQGGTFEDLRIAHAEELTELDLDGYAVGGLAVGEDHGTMLDMVEVLQTSSNEQNRYLMGVGCTRYGGSGTQRNCLFVAYSPPVRTARNRVLVSRLNLKMPYTRASPLDPGVLWSAQHTLVPI